MTAKLNSYGFAPLVVFLMAVLFGLTDEWSGHAFSGLRRDFRVVQSESFHLAFQVERGCWP